MGPHLKGEFKERGPEKKSFVGGYAWYIFTMWLLNKNKSTFLHYRDISESPHAFERLKSHDKPLG